MKILFLSLSALILSACSDVTGKDFSSEIASVELTSNTVSECVVRRGVSRCK